jgi:hypothetical protein
VTFGKNSGIMGLLVERPARTEGSDRMMRTARQGQSSESVSLMIPFSDYFRSKPPSLRSLPLKRYRIHLSLSRLNFGVDSIHIDVHISPQVCSAVRRAAAVSLIKHSRSEAFFEGEKKERRGDEKLALKNLCTEVLREGITRARAAAEVQIDYLGQVALAKLFLEEIGSEYQKLIKNFEILVRDFQLSRDYDQREWLKIKEKLTEIKSNRGGIVRLAGEELFQVLADVQARNLKNIREANFPSESILPDHFFINPTLHTDKVADDFLLAESYVLMGQRADEPDNYGSLKAVIGPARADGSGERGHRRGRK